ncbi:MAG: ABC transporter ATP-binding protein [Chloroflexota bacterium]
MAENVLEVRSVVKRYDGVTAVDDLSFEVRRGEIFGLLGPNGAGKTTTIRMVMDILRPDDGVVRVLGQTPGNSRERVGYLPEERGLYRDLKVLDVLVYLAELKGISRSEARRRGMAWLERVELADWAERRIKDLSRGMQQKAQLAASLVHEPELAILDEPFQGLDPVNVELVKGIIRRLQREGATVVLSSHQMNLVEALCDRILLVNHGRSVLYGPLAEIKRRHSAQTVRLRTPADLGTLPGVEGIEHREGTFVLRLGDGSPQDLLRALVQRNIPLDSFEVATAPLDEVFIAAVKGAEHA